MSQAVAKFKSSFGNPQNTHKFVVVIPGWSDDPLLVTSTSAPSEKLRNYQLYIFGEGIRYPTIPELNGEWAVTIPENEDFSVMRQVLKSKGKIFNQHTGSLVMAAAKDGGTLNSPVEIYPLTMDYRAHLQIQLYGWFILGVDDVNLDSSTATQHMVRNISFSYDYKEEKMSDPLPSADHEVNWTWSGASDFAKESGSFVPTTGASE